MRLLAKPFEASLLCDLSQACEPYGVILSVPGGGPPPSFYIGVAPTIAELQGNTDIFKAAKNQHVPSVGSVIGDIGGSSGFAASHFETFVFAPLMDKLYAVCSPATDDVYIDVQIYRMGRNVPNSSGLPLPGGD